MPSDHDLTITIKSGLGSREFTFAKQTKVQDAANEAAVGLGYPPGGIYTLVRFNTNEQLDGQRPLVSYHIEDGEVLVLSEVGTGV